MKETGRQKTSSLNSSTTQKKKKKNNQQPAFTGIPHQARINDQNTDLSGYRQPQPGEMIANVMRSMEAGTDNQPAFSTQDNELTSPRPESRVNRPIVQTKLTIGRPNDKYEQEADRVAAQVVRQINRPAPKTTPQEGMVQGKKEEKGKEKNPDAAKSDISAKPQEITIQRMPSIQTQEAIGGGEASAELSAQINQARGGGQTLDPGLQQSMGQAMGADFSGVRVHTDAQADKLNRSLRSRAFTRGKDVFFKTGEYQPYSRGGKELISHELTHVLQQGQNVIRRGDDDEFTKIGKVDEEMRSKPNMYESDLRWKSNFIDAIVKPETCLILLINENTSFHGHTSLVFQGYDSINRRVWTQVVSLVPEQTPHYRPEKPLTITEKVLGRYNYDPSYTVIDEKTQEEFYKIIPEQTAKVRGKIIEDNQNDDMYWIDQGLAKHKIVYRVTLEKCQDLQKLVNEARKHPPNYATIGDPITWYKRLPNTARPENCHTWAVSMLEKGGFNVPKLAKHTWAPKATEGLPGIIESFKRITSQAT